MNISNAETSLRKAIRASYRTDEAMLVEQLAQVAQLSADNTRAALQSATELVRHIVINAEKWAVSTL